MEMDYTIVLKGHDIEWESFAILVNDVIAKSKPQSWIVIQVAKPLYSNAVEVPMDQTTYLSHTVSNRSQELPDLSTKPYSPSAQATEEYTSSSLEGHSTDSTGGIDRTDSTAGIDSTGSTRGTDSTGSTGGVYSTDSTRDIYSTNSTGGTGSTDSSGDIDRTDSTGDIYSTDSTGGIYSTDSTGGVYSTDITRDIYSTDSTAVNGYELSSVEVIQTTPIDVQTTDTPSPQVTGQATSSPFKGHSTTGTTLNGYELSTVEPIQSTDIGSQSDESPGPTTSMWYRSESSLITSDNTMSTIMTGHDTTTQPGYTDDGTTTQHTFAYTISTDGLLPLTTNSPSWGLVQLSVTISATYSL